MKSIFFFLIMSVGIFVLMVYEAPTGPVTLTEIHKTLVLTTFLIIYGILLILHELYDIKNKK